MLLWIYGKPYSGKSKFAYEFPDPYVISTDNNAQYFGIPNVYVRTVEEFSEALDKFKKKPDHKTLIIDTLDGLQDSVREFCLDKFNIDDEGDLEFGKGWRAVREGMKKAVLSSTKLRDTDVIWISLEDEYTEKSKLGVEVTKYRPSINPKIHDDLSGKTTMILHAYKDLKNKDGVAYKISIGSTSNELSGTRIPIKSKLINNSYKDFINNLKK